VNNTGSILFLVFFFGLFVIIVLVIWKKRNKYRGVPGANFPFTDSSTNSLNDMNTPHSLHGHHSHDSFDAGHHSGYDSGFDSSHGSIDTTSTGPDLDF
jgi:hypothetical protein